MDLPKLIDDVLNEVSGKNAWDWAARISQYHRMRGSKDYHKIVIQVVEELNRYGLDEVEVLKYPADGKSKTWDWIAPFGWEINSGELRLVDPNEELLCRYKDIPMCVLVHSKSCDIITELIDVGEGVKEEDYEGKNVKGKIVLMEAPKLMVSPFYITRGAIGIIVYPSSERSAGYRGMTIYSRFPAKSEILEKTTFGFSITYEQAMYLKELLKKGKVKIHAKIDAKLFKGELEVISAAIHGTEIPEEEIILTAHICHPKAGANDNASGSAGLMEIARSLTTLIKKNILPAPKRTFRFLWIPEFDGTWPWAKEHEKKAKNALFNLNLDMIGEHPMKIGEPCEVCLAPYSRPSTLNDIIVYFTEKIADNPKGIASNGTNVPMRYRILPFSGGSDQQVFADNAIGIPSMMFGHSDPLWHSSLDTIENVDTTEMQRVIGIALCTSYIFSILDGKSLHNIWPILEENFYQRLGNVKKILLNLYNLIHFTTKTSKEETAILGEALINTAINYEKSVLNSINRYDDSHFIENEFVKLKYQELNQWYQNQKNLWINLCKQDGIDIIAIEEPVFLKDKWILIMKSLKSLVDYLPIVTSIQYNNIKSPEPPDLWYGDLHEIFNLVGLSFNLKMICAMLTLEFQHIFYPSEVYKLLEFLERKSFIKKI